MENKISLTLLLCCFFSMQSIFEKMVAIKPVVDLRTAPVDIGEITFPASSQINQYQGSQLLMGDFVSVKRQFVDKQGVLWLYVNAIEQQRFSQDLGWHGFPGWVKASDLAPIQDFEQANARVKYYITPVYDDHDAILFWLSVGTKLCLDQCKRNDFCRINLVNGAQGYIQAEHVHDQQNFLDQESLRLSIVHLAKQFLGTLYCWGGRSAQSQSFVVSGVDCSGLINIIFAAHHISVPRTAHDQYLQAYKIKQGKNLKPGDLVYICPISSQSPQSCRMTHVFLYVGDGMLLESTLSGDGSVRMISFQERIGKDLYECQSGDSSSKITSQGQLGTKYRIYFASFLEKV